MGVAFRGNTRLDDNVALRAHLANLLRLENVGLLLGAGASISAGGKVIRDVWKDLLAKDGNSALWLETQKFIVEDQLDPDGDPPNIETLADRIAIAIAEWKRIDDEKLEDAKAAMDSLHRAVIRAAILQADWWSKPFAVSFDEARLLEHRTVLQKMTSSRQPGQASPWVFTTNYDLAVEWAAESIDMSVVNGFIGTHSRRFSPQSFDLAFRNAQARGEDRFGTYNLYLAKLHGSLTWKENNGQFFEEQASGAWSAIKAFADGTGPHPGTLVLPSAAKYIQTIGFVLGELFRRFAEFLARPQTCLIVSGYGFGDEHVNRLLISALLNPTLQLVIYFPTFKGIDDPAGLPVAVRRLIALQNPRITMVGDGAAAYFSGLARDLPDPAIYDEDLAALEKRLRQPVVLAGAPS
jgi:hypothetical protein